MADEKHVEASDVLKRLGISQIIGAEQESMIVSITRKISKGPIRVFECEPCSTRFRIANAKDGTIYKCPNCKNDAKEITPEEVTSKAKKSELVLDETIPPEVQQAVKNPENIFGNYVLLEKVGAGAMGAVFRAFDVDLSRTAALKFLNQERFAELKEEARTLAALDHKNIARIYEIGTAKGKAFISMQFINGKSLNINPWAERRGIEFMLAVCDAIEYAHRRKVIHRDIKPQNIMVEDSGNIFITDFGLAIKGETHGGIAGTPGFMPPEIANCYPATPESDVYSICGTLYFLLAGRPPITFAENEDLDSVLGKVRSGNYVVIRRVCPNIAKELEAVIEKGLSKDPYKRYHSAAALKEDLRRYMAGQAVEAYSEKLTYRVRKSIVKNKVQVLYMLSKIAVVVGLVLSVLLFDRHRILEESFRQEGMASARNLAEQAILPIEYDEEARLAKMLDRFREANGVASAEVFSNRTQKRIVSGPAIPSDTRYYQKDVLKGGVTMLSDSKAGTTIFQSTIYSREMRDTKEILTERGKVQISYPTTEIKEAKSDMIVALSATAAVSLISVVLFIYLEVQRRKIP